MNLFWLALHPRESAQAHVDKHVVKMILEATQLLYAAHHVNQLDDSWRTRAPAVASARGSAASTQGGYRLTHKNHPCSVWVRQSRHHYLKACELGLELCTEYTCRYGRTHACQEHLEFLQANPPPFPSNVDAPPPCVMPDEYKTSPADTWQGVITCYRNYYLGAKQALAKWTKRAPPAWWPQPASRNKRARRHSASDKE